MSSQNPIPETNKSVSFNDLFIMTTLFDSEGQPVIYYLTRDDYDNADMFEIVERIDNNGDVEKRFFLDENNVYPMNLIGSAVSKVIPWNLEGKDSYYQPGYFIDLRQLSMARINMVKIKNALYFPSATPIPNENLPVATGFNSVPSDKLSQLVNAQNYNLYIAFFNEKDATHSESNCYSYSIAYIPAKKLQSYEVQENYKLQENYKYIKNYLESYYGHTKIQTGGVNPYDMEATKSIEKPNSTGATTDDLVNIDDILVSADGLTCYVANLRTFANS